MWLVAFCLPLHENQVKAKHVESSLVPRLDEGSNPSSSTKKDAIRYLFFVLIRDENPNRGFIIAKRFRRKNPSSSTKKDAIRYLFFVLIRDENQNRGFVIAKRFRRKNPSSSTKKEA